MTSLLDIHIAAKRSEKERTTGDGVSGRTKKCDRDTNAREQVSAQADERSEEGVRVINRIRLLPLTLILSPMGRGDHRR